MLTAVIVSRWVYILLTLSSSALTFISDLVTFHPPCATAAMSLCNKCSVALVADEDPPWWWWLLAAADTSSALAAWPGFEDEPPPKFGELQNENIFDQTTTPTEAIFGAPAEERCRLSGRARSQRLQKYNIFTVVNNIDE